MRNGFFSSDVELAKFYKFCYACFLQKWFKLIEYEQISARLMLHNKANSEMYKA